MPHADTLRIVADEIIPLVPETFGRFGEVLQVPAQEITPTLVKNADVLLVRSVTRVDEKLVAGSKLRFVGSATIGEDHVDTEALARAGIVFRNAPGSNAESVVEYVLAALLTLAVRLERPLRGLTVGVVGCGHIGSRLAQRLPAFGVRVLQNDPPLADEAERAGQAHEYAGLDQVLAESDVVTLHVPLTTAGPYPTRHLIGAHELARLRRDAWLINTSRGAVVSNSALAAVLEVGALGAAVLDVWEGEPQPGETLLQLTAVATPHIAGYSWDGKVTGTLMLHVALVQDLGLPHQAWDAAAAFAGDEQDRLDLEPPPPMPEAEWLHALTRQLYDIEADDARMRTLLALPPTASAAMFNELRRTYPKRRAFQRHVLPDASLPEEFRIPVREGLHVSASAGAPATADTV